MSANRKLTRRKRKLHHGPSSLLRATIQEYGIYDRQVDALKAEFIDSFDFLESWQKNLAKNEKVKSQSLRPLWGSIKMFCTMPTKPEIVIIFLSLLDIIRLIIIRTIPSQKLTMSYIPIVLNDDLLQVFEA